MTETGGPGSSRDGAPRGPRSIRSQLLLWVDLVVGVGLLALIALDYRQELNERTRDKQVALEEEAKTLLPAVVRLQALGPEAVQAHIDDVCGRMQEVSSPGHHIAVRIGSRVLQARAHHRASPEILEAMVRAASAPERTVRLADDELVAGASGDGAVRVYVSEVLSSLRRKVRARMFRRAAVILGLGVVATLLVHLVLSRIVTRPLGRLVTTVRSIANGRLGAKSGAFESEELQFLATEIDAMSSALGEAEAARLRELEKARRVQARLSAVPKHVPGMRLAPLYRPAAHVAGDYFDVLPLRDGSWLLCVADVSGHGVPAALVAAVLKTLLLTAAERETDPGRILEAVNRRICEVLLPGDFATAVLVRWDPADSSVVCASAGHERILVLERDGRIESLESTGMILGVECDEEWATERRAVRPGTRLLLFTDGVTESMAPDRSLFGSERLVRLLTEHGGAAVEQVLERIESALSDHRGGEEQQDDVTLLLAELVQSAGAGRDAGGGSDSAASTKP